MNTVVYFLHSLVTLLVPVLFGWVVLRRVARETDWYTLVPGSVVVGLVALMALMNELRFIFPMERSVWFAYKLLLLLALLLILTTRRHRSPPGLPRRAAAWWRMALVIGGAGLVAVFFGIPASRGILNDAWWFHLPVATQIQTVPLFPLPAPFAPDDPLYYHIGPDILAATWSQLFDRPIAFGYVCNVLLLAPAAFGLAFALVLRLSRNYLAALAGAGLLLVGGNLRFLGLAATDPGTGGSAALLAVFNSQTVEGLLELMFTPSHAVGVPAVLAGLVLFRHFAARGGWPLAAALGLWMGALTLIAEWYFLPFFGGVAVWAALRLGRRLRERRPWRQPLACALLALTVAPAWALFNNTYAAGIFTHFWWHPPTHAVTAAARVNEWRILSAGNQQFDLPPPPIPVWSPPPLLPLRFNSSHFGQVPSWEGAGSLGESFIPLASTRFLGEFFPVIGLGLPFLFWLWWRQRHPVIFLLVFMAGIALIPPVFLDWGYRSSDFLRFFTASFALSALGCGWLIGWLWQSGTKSRRAGAVALAGVGFANALGLGLIGLRPDTLQVVQAVSLKASSLSSEIGKTAPAVTPGGSTRDQAFISLAGQLDRFLTPITAGRARVVVIVPVDQVPPLDVFPDWLKLATLSRLLLPIGLNWKDSLYAGYYREAVTQLDAPAVAALGAQWVVVSNLFQAETPAAVEAALLDRTRFAPAARFRAGEYDLRLYRVRP